MSKERLDKIVMDRGLFTDSKKAKAVIMSGNVLVDGVPSDKSGTLVSTGSIITLKEKSIPYVSRGALKLEKALLHFNVDPTDLFCLDIGSSTGGFTDCLLQGGAKKVYAVDVGYGQLDWKLRQDSRVVTMERTNIRHLEEDAIENKVDLTVIDTSFISLKTVIPSALKFMKESSKILALIKPQFEVARGQVGKGGIVSDPELHDEVKEKLTIFFEGINLKSMGICDSPIRGTKGNKEFIIFLKV
jgi:23S rRNA (cytidine1920-2'-O)/16S rRNA (cytidine1409-2'-O)-methyltransferase